jgi:chitinase
MNFAGVKIRMAYRVVVSGILLLCWLSGRGQNLIAYYSGGVKEIDRYPVEKLSHIIYSFGHLRGNTMHISDTATVKKLTSLKRRYPSLKILLSLGGWGGCKTCSPVFSTEKGREDFALSVAKLCGKFNTDGIDIDWEFPAAVGFPGHPYSDADRENFTKLIRTLRDKLGSEKEISFLAACFAPYLQTSFEWKRVMAIADRVNLMTYDIIGSRNKLTGHHANLYSTASQNESADHAVRYLDSLGIPLSKVVIGVAFYAREFINVPDINNGLHQPGQFKRFITLNAIRKNFGPAAGYQQYWDVEAKAPYRYSPLKRSYLSYDDERSAREKAKYVVAKKLNGLMFWELRQDATGNMVNVMFEQMRNKD